MFKNAQFALCIAAYLSIVSLLAGCQSAVWNDLVGEPPDVVPGVTPPSQRINELRKLAAEADERSPEQRERIARRLAEEIVQEKDAGLRAEIVHTLAAYPTETGRGVLRRALRDPDRQVRIAACRAWGRLATDEAVELLGETLRRDADIDVRLAATEALGETRQGAAAAALGDALADSDPALQYRAMRSLRQVTGQNLDTVGQWKQYLATGEVPSSPGFSIAERLGRIF